MRYVLLLSLLSLFDALAQDEPRLFRWNPLYVGPLPAPLEAYLPHLW